MGSFSESIRGGSIVELPALYQKGANMSNKTYDVWKFVAQIVLPALGTLYAALAGIWGLPFGQEIVGTVAAVDTFLGAILHINAKGYAADQVAVEAGTDAQE